MRAVYNASKAVKLNGGFHNQVSWTGPLLLLTACLCSRQSHPEVRLPFSHKYNEYPYYESVAVEAPSTADRATAAANSASAGAAGSPGRVLLPPVRPDLNREVLFTVRVSRRVGGSDVEVDLSPLRDLKVLPFAALRRSRYNTQCDSSGTPAQPPDADLVARCRQGCAVQNGLLNETTWQCHYWVPVQSLCIRLKEDAAAPAGWAFDYTK